MTVYRAYCLIEDLGSYQEFYRSPWYISKELAQEFINKNGIKSGKCDGEWEIQSMQIEEIVEDISDIEDYGAYHEFDSE